MNHFGHCKDEIAQAANCSSITRLECHGPKNELERLENLKEVGAVFYELDENAVRRTYSGAKPDKHISLHPYFKVKDGHLE